jgi:hypothetical protein
LAPALAQNSPKYFAAVEIVERATNAEWLSSATKVIAKQLASKESAEAADVRVGLIAAVELSGPKLGVALIERRALLLSRTICWTTVR